MNSKKTNGDPYYVAYLLDLKTQVVWRYGLNKQVEGENTVLLIPNSKNSPHIKNLQEDILKRIGVEIPIGSIFNALYHEDNEENKKQLRWLKKKNIDNIRLYINTPHPDDLTLEGGGENKLLGAKEINSAYKKYLETSKLDFSPEDFYIYKLIDDCQWYGIAQGWDKERESHGFAKQQTALAFKSLNSISLVVKGEQGSGKSTFLRRLCLSCTDLGFKILWVTDFVYFTDHEVLELSKQKDVKYLVCVEDWSKYANYLVSKEFLDRVNNAKNIRVIIGDLSKTSRRDYEDYLSSPKNIIPIKPSENKIILGRVFIEMDRWEKIAERTLPPDFFNSPLFLILFVLARSDEQDQNKIDKTEGVLGQFRKIIFRDIQFFGKFLPALANALVWYAYLYSKHKITIKHNSFLWLVHKGSRSLEEGLSLQNRFKNPDSKDPMWEVASHYIYLRYEVTSNRPDHYYTNFHHDLLVEGLLSVLGDSLPAFEAEVEDELIGLMQRAGEIVVYETKQGTEWQWFKTFRMSQRMGDKSLAGLDELMNTFIKAMLLDCRKEKDDH